MTESIKLTQYCHGCGCKIAPSVLAEMLAAMPRAPSYPNLLVGTESSDDAAVYKLNESQAIVVTTDFFMPILPAALQLAQQGYATGAAERNWNSYGAEHAPQNAPFKITPQLPQALSRLTSSACAPIAAAAASQRS